MMFLEPRRDQFSPYHRRLRQVFVTVLVVVSLLAACGSEDSGGAGTDTEAAVGGRIAVVTTTTHIADFARQVAGERADVTSLLPANADAHDYEPTPRDVERVADADLVLQHGMGLDEWAAGLINDSGTRAMVVTVTSGITTLVPGEDEHDEDIDEHAEDDHHHDGDDPHVWFDVANAKVMVENVRGALIEVDPDGAATYEANTTAYLGQLDELDTWIREQIATIPEDQRKLVTNHDAFGYYVHAYGLEFIGAIIPSLDAQAQPSARETAQLVDRIREENVKAIFTETSINPNLANRIASEAGVIVVDNLYGDSLGEPGSGADTYIGMMRTNTTAIVEGLR
jgi:zinc/manganese transport system substrate-binding protein